jgi:WD40 repeat protein
MYLMYLELKVGMETLAECYEILGLANGASGDSVKQAYLQQAKKWHPDRFTDPKQRQQAEEQFKQINAAYQRLKSHHENTARHPASSSAKTQPQSHPPRGTHTTATRLEALYEQAVSAVQLNQYPEAIDALSQVIRLNPTFLKAFQLRAFLYEKVGRPYSAQSDFERIATLKKDSASQASSPKSAPQRSYAKATARSASSFSKTSELSWSCVQTLTIEDSVNAIAFSPDRTLFVTGGTDGILRLWQCFKQYHPEKISELIAELRGHRGPIQRVLFSRDGRSLISVSTDQTIRFWHLPTRRPKRTLGGGFDGHSAAVLALALRLDETMLISGGADRTLQLWNLKTGEVLHKFEDFTTVVSAIAHHPHAGIWLNNGSGSQVQVRQFPNAEIVQMLDLGAEVMALATSWDDTFQAGGCVNGQLSLWKANGFRKEADLIGHGDSVTCLAFMPDSQLLISGSSDRTIRLWNCQTHQPVAILEGHTGPIQAIASHGHQPLLISGAQDGTVKFWYKHP